MLVNHWIILYKASCNIQSYLLSWKCHSQRCCAVSRIHNSYMSINVCSHPNLNIVSNKFSAAHEEVLHLQMQLSIMWKMLLVVIVIQHCSSQLYAVFQRLSAIFFLCFLACNFIVLVHSHCSNQPCFQQQQATVFRENTLKVHHTLPAQHKTSERQSLKLAGEHSGAFRS